MNLKSSAAGTTEPKFNTIWLPLLVGLLMFVVTSMFSWFLYQQMAAERLVNISVMNSKISMNVQNDFLARVSDLQRLTKQWEVHGGFTEAEFNADVQRFINENPGFQAVEWVDSNYYVRWIVPFAANEAAQNLFLAKEEKRRLALEAARNIDAPTMTAPITLVQGGKGFLVYFPIFMQGKFEGFILGVFRAEEWLTYVLESETDGNNLVTAITIDDELIYKQNGWDTVNGSTSLGQVGPNFEANVVTLNLLDHRFIIQSLPSLAYLKNNQIFMPQMVGFIGCLFSIILGVMVRLFQKANSEAWRTYAAKSALENEIQEHQKTSGELLQTLGRLDMATKAGGIGVWSWHIPTNYLNWNERMFVLFDIPSDIVPMYETWRSALHPEDILEAESLLTRAVEGKAIFNTEFRIVLPSGELRYLGAAARVERDFAGRPIRVNGINWDLTNLKQAELTLKKAKLRYACCSTLQLRQYMALI